MKLKLLVLFSLLASFTSAEIFQGRLVIKPLAMDAFSFVFVADVSTNRLALSALTPTGLKAFELAGTNGCLASYTMEEAIPAARRAWLARSLFTAAWRIYATPFNPARPAIRRDSRHVWQRQPSGELLRYTFEPQKSCAAEGFPPLALRNSTFWGPSWCVLFSKNRALYTTAFINYTFEFQRKLNP